MADIEEIVLSCIFYDEKQEYVKAPLLNEKWFKNKTLFKKVVKYRIDKKPMEEAIYNDYFNQDERFILVGGISGIHNIHNFDSFYKKLISTRIQEKMFIDMERGSFEPSDYWEVLKEISENKTTLNIYDFSNDIHKYLKKYDEMSSGNYEKYLLGLEGVDEVIGNVRPKTLITFGANSGVGKTNIMLKIMGNLLDQNIRCLYLTAEMSFEQILERMASMCSNLSLFRIRNHNLSEIERKEYYGLIKKRIYEKQGHILEIPKFDNTKIRKVITDIQPKFVFIDYIQRFNLESAKNLSRASILSDIVNELKAIAMECGIVVITASQLNRTSDKSNANISALKESGAIEEASDIVMLLSTIDNTEKQKAIRISIDKNRYGVEGKFIYIFDKKNCNMSYSEECTLKERNKDKPKEEDRKQRHLEAKNPDHFQN